MLSFNWTAKVVFLLGYRELDMTRNKDVITM